MIFLFFITFHCLNSFTALPPAAHLLLRRYSHLSLKGASGRKFRKQKFKYPYFAQQYVGLITTIKLKSVDNP